MPHVDAKYIPQLRRLLKSALKHPECLWSMIAFAQPMVLAPDFAGHDLVARRAQRAAYDSRSRCFAWITQPRSRAELEALADIECTCPAKERRSIFHLDVQKQFRTLQTDHFFEQRPFFFLIEVFLHPMSLFMRPPDSKEPPRGMKQLHRRVRWPRSTADMLPHGAEDTTRGLIYLLELDLNTGARRGVMYALAMVMINFHPLVMPILVTSRTLITKGIIAAIHSDIDCVTSSGHSIKPNDVKAVYQSQATLLHIVKDLVTRLSTTAQRKAFHVQAPTELLIAYDRATKLFPLLQANTSHFSPEHIIPELFQPDPFIKSLKKIAGKLLIDVPVVADILPQLEARDHFMSPPYNFAYWQLWKDFLHNVHLLEVMQRCMAPGCAETALTSTLKRCASCKRVRYCSRACQKAAWRHSLSHRLVCYMLSELCDEFSLPRAEVRTSAPTSTREHFMPLKVSVGAVTVYFDALAQFSMASFCESTRLDL
jgi:hypothetical protein